MEKLSRKLLRVGAARWQQQPSGHLSNLSALRDGGNLQISSLPEIGTFSVLRKTLSTPFDITAWTQIFPWKNLIKSAQKHMKLCQTPVNCDLWSLNCRRSGNNREISWIMCVTDVGGRTKMGVWGRVKEFACSHRDIFSDCQWTQLKPRCYIITCVGSGFDSRQSLGR